MRRKRSKNVSAAIAGSEEVAAELSGNMTAAAKYGAREKASRGGKPQGSRNRGSNGARHTFESLNLVNVSAAPKPVIYEMLSGRRAGTELMRDRGFPAKPAAIIYNIDAWQWEGVGKTHWFQSASASFDLQVDALVGGEMTSLYSSIVRELASHRGRLFAIRDTTLANAGTFNSLPQWLNRYCTAYAIIMCLKSVLESGDFNYTTSLMAAAVDQNLPRLQADMLRLSEICVPQGLVDILTRICGVKAWDKDSPALICGLSNQGVAPNPPLDLTLPASVVSYLGIAELALNTLIVGDGVSILGPEAQEISNIFAYSYGPTKLPTNLGVSYDQVEVMMYLGSVVTYDDTTSHLQFSFPNANVTTLGVNDIPMLIPRGASGPAMQQFFSLLRAPVYSVDLLTGNSDITTAVPSQIGLFTNTSVNTTRNSEYGVYNQAGVFALTTSQAAGAITVTALGPANSAYWWAPEASGELTNYNADFRTFLDCDRIWLDKNWLATETILFIEEIFLDPLRKSGGALV